MDGTFVFRLVKDKFHSISIWQLWMLNESLYFVGKGGYTPEASTPECVRINYDKMIDAFNHPVIDIKDIKE